MITNLFIIGAHKSGTSTLFDILKSQQGICCSTPKEPNIFSKKVDLIKNEKKIYSNKYKHDYSFFCEASTSYFNELYAIERIFKSCVPSNVKFIILLRKPEDRALSAYFHLYKRLDETRKLDDVFSKYLVNSSNIIQDEESLLRDAILNKLVDINRYKDRYDDFLWPFKYLTINFYSIYIENIFYYFPKSNILFLLFDDLKSNMNKIYFQLSNFLNIDIFSNNFNNIHSNKTYVPKLVPYNYYLIHNFFLKTKFGNKAIKNKTLRKIYYKHLFEDKPYVSNDFKNQIKECFVDDVKKTSELIGIDLIQKWEY